MEYNLVEMWLRRDPIRWVAGVLAGLLAGTLTLGFAGWVAQQSGFEFFFPVKLMATTVLGPSATAFDAPINSIYLGAGVFYALAALLGFVFAHFTGVNSLYALLPMGLVWGIFSWIFIWNLFLQSFRPIFAAQLSSGLVLPICLVFGLSLASVAFFDRVMRRN